MFRFLTRQNFFVNLLAAIALVVLIIFAFLWSLGFITHHGEYEKVPGIQGKTLVQAQQALESKGFKVEVLDSLYYDSLPPLVVIKQSPEGEQMVKSNRVIYLTVNRSQPPLVEVPNMVGFTFRNAEMYLRQLNLKLGDTTRRPDLAKDAVLEQSYQGKAITSGTKIFIGSKISFVLGSGLGDEQFNVPNLVGMTYEEAKAALSAQSLNFGSPVALGGISDTLHAYVVRQYPKVKEEPDENGYVQINKIRAGQVIDMWLSRQQPNVEEVDSITNPKSSRPKTTAPKKEKDNDY